MGGDLPLPGQYFFITGNHARSIQLEDPRLEKIHPCLHMQLMSSSHPSHQSLFGRHRTSPSSATEPAQLHCTNQNGNLTQLQAWPLECQGPFLLHTSSAQTCWQPPSPHFVSSRLQLSSSLSGSVEHPAVLDVVDSDQPLSTLLRAGGAVISTPSTRACDSSSSVTAAKATTKACCYELQQPRGMASLVGQVLLLQSFSQALLQKLYGILLSPSSCSETCSGEC